MEVSIKELTCWKSKPSGTVHAQSTALIDSDFVHNRKVLIDNISVHFVPGSVTAIYGYGVLPAPPLLDSCLKK